MKPRIKKGLHPYWICTIGSNSGVGTSPRAAYFDCMLSVKSFGELGIFNRLSKDSLHERLTRCNKIELNRIERRRERLESFPWWQRMTKD